MFIFFSNFQKKYLDFFQKMKNLDFFWPKMSNFSIETLKKLRNIEKHWETLRHWKNWAIFQLIDSKTLNSIQCQCDKLKHWKDTQCQCQCQFFQCFNVSLNVQCRFAGP